jgi:predicted ribosome quality control (RQC) complex YloA/Tae2 family protein
MANILSQEEIDEDELLQDLGSENFEKIYNEYHEWRRNLEKGYSPENFGINPEETLEGLETDNQWFLETAENYKEFKKFYDKFKEITDKEPEIFI